MATISVIIPVYNAEKFLKKCVRSVLDSTFLDIEVILVNNGSSDQSLAICNELSSEDNRVVVIDTKIKGISNARNLGLEKAKGQYIGFVDSDDYIDATMYEALYNQLVKCTCDVAICNYVVEVFNGEEGKAKNNVEDSTVKEAGGNISQELLEDVLENQVLLQPTIIIEHEAILEAFLHNSIKGYVWNKLFKKEVLEGISFDENTRFSEDQLFLWQGLRKSRGVVKAEPILYHYVEHKGNVTARPDFYTLWDRVRVQEKIYKESQKEHDQGKTLAGYNYIKTLISMALYMAEHEVHSKSHEKVIERELTRNKRLIKKANIKRSWKFYGRVIAEDFHLFRWTYTWIRQIKRVKKLIMN